MVNPLKSKRFLTMLLDIIISTAMFFVWKYSAPDTQDNIKFLIVTWQPVFIFLIGAYAVEDLQLAKSNPFR